MVEQNVISQPVPDFGALLESVKENGRLMRESAERFYKQQAERDAEREAKLDARWEKECQEREKERQKREKERQKREKERQKREKERKELEAKWEKERKEREAKWEKERKEHEAKWEKERLEREKERKEREAKWEKERKEREAQWERERKAHREEYEEAERKRDEKWEKERRETDRIMRKTDNRIDAMVNLFTTQWDKLVEALCKPAALKLFKQSGIGIQRICKECALATDPVDGSDRMEIDVLYENNHVMVATEVKTTCYVSDVKKFITKMKHFKESFPTYANKVVYGAMAAIKYTQSADIYARRKGLFTLTFSGKDTFTMEEPNFRKDFCKEAYTEENSLSD